MSRYAAYMGRVVEYDLSTQTLKNYDISDEDRKLYIGGKAIANKIMYDNLTGKEEAFSKENIIIISTGPLTGTGAPSSSRFDISTISPLTGLTTSSNCGGRFGYYLKKAGYDALILKGQCDKPSWLEINNDSFILHDADELWGLNTFETQNKLDEIHVLKNGNRIKHGQLCIGPAGENKVLYASVISDERVAGRAGVGAIFGYKNLKAITSRGNKEVSIYNQEKTTAWIRKWNKYLKNHPLTGEKLPKYGTANLVSLMQERKLLSTKNYLYGSFDQYEKISGEFLAEKYNIVNKGCLSCPIRCARTVNINGVDVKGPELETLVLLGSGLCNDDLYSILKFNKELDDLGLDTISTANTISWAMEANEKGIWNNPLEFSKNDNLSEIFKKIAYRQDIGDELAQGSKRLSEKYGGKEFAINSKGLELAAYEPRRAVGQGLGYAVSNRGGCHLNGGYLVILEGLGLNTDSQTTKAKADLTMMFQDLLEAISASGQCLFTSYALFPSVLINKPKGLLTTICNKAIPHIGPIVRLINKYPLALAFNLPIFQHTKMIKYTTGMNMTFGKYLRIGERSFTMERMLNTKFGVNASLDTLPKRLTNEPQDKNDPNTKVPLEQMKYKYYKARGWDQNGIPTKKTLKKLKIEV